MTSSSTPATPPAASPPRDLWGDLRSMLWDWNTNPNACIARIHRLDRNQQIHVIIALLGVVQATEPDMGALMRLLNVAEAGVTP